MGDQRSQDRGNIPRENDLACVAERTDLSGQAQAIDCAGRLHYCAFIIDADIASCHTSSRARDIKLLLVLSPSHVCTKISRLGVELLLVPVEQITKPLLKPLTRRGYR